MYYYDGKEPGSKVVEITRGDSKRGTYESVTVRGVAPGVVAVGERRSGTYG